MTTLSLLSKQLLIFMCVYFFSCGIQEMNYAADRSNVVISIDKVSNNLFYAYFSIFLSITSLFFQVP